ncbi:MAG: hypothetical protein WCF28_05580 [Methanobacterium sp.]|uniref:hypothetical protein n=1 Tax=Methanobacterium sp. TaxID=2164 RepID=UPI003C708EBE
MKKEVCLLFICVIMINITPACAVNIGEMNNDLQNLSNSKDIQTINNWKNSNGWNRFWHFGGFCSAVYHLSSQSDSITKDVKALNSTLNETCENLTTLKGFLENQDKLNTELSNYLKQNSNGDSPASPASAVNDADNVKNELKKINKTIDVSVNENVKEPQKYDVVQLISDVSNDKGDHTLHYWFLKQVFTDNDTGESMVTLYNGNSYISMTYKTFKKKFTGVVLHVNDIQQLNNNNNNSNVISSNTNQTADQQSTVPSLTNQSSTSTNSSNNTVANQTLTTTNQTNYLASVDKANSAALCDIVDTIYTIKSNDLSTLLSSIPAYDYDLVKLLTLLSAIFAILGTVIWVVGGILCCVPMLVGWGIAICVFGGLLCVAGGAMSIYAAMMHDSRDDSNRLSDILKNINSHSIS